MAHEMIQRILDEKLFAVIRLRDTSPLVQVVDAIVAGGISIIEITLTSTDALERIELLVNRFPHCMIGAGTVIGKKDAEAAIGAGAKFLVSPIVDTKVIAIARDNGVPSMAGALTPTEVHYAHSSGADFIKLFPLVGLGPSYVRAMRGPLPNIRYVATNGVTIDSITEFLTAGCSSIGLGSALVTDADIANRSYTTVKDRAEAAVAALKQSR